MSDWRATHAQEAAASRRQIIALVVTLILSSVQTPSRVLADGAEAQNGSAAFSATPYTTVVVPNVKTSIYIGSVTLTMTPLQRGADQVYVADYKATVVPFFMFNESGQFRIPFSDEQLAQLERGERVEFSGEGKNSKGKNRPVKGHAQAATPNSKSGKIKVRVFVTKKTDLVFNADYTFESPIPAPNDEQPGDIPK